MLLTNYKTESIPVIKWDQLNKKSLNYITQIVNTYGTGILEKADETGFYPIHWAVISGIPDLVEFVISANVFVRTVAELDDRPEPIHMAALEGHIPIINILVKHGIDINVKDLSGCTPLMRAASFGYNNKTKTCETILHLLSCGSDLTLTDANGLNCLHYAIINNNEEAVHLLLNLGLNPNQMTNNGLRAIHFAAKSGNEYLMRLLGPLTNDMTQSQLESMINMHKKNKGFDVLSKLATLLGQSVVLICILSTIFWAYPQYILYYMPNSQQILLNTLLIAINLMAWISWYRTCTSDPGYLQQNTSEYNKILKKIHDTRHETNINDNKISQRYAYLRLCHTCKTVQTMRSTHCRFCNRCTAGYDHHCIYLSTCIGLNNRIPFFCLNISLLLGGLMGALLVYTVSNLDDLSLYSSYHWFNFLYCLQFTTIGLIMSFCNIRRAAINLTQNEEFKAWKQRYQHLIDSNGKFVNPYDRGFWKNVCEYFTTKPYKYSKVNTFDQIV
ncbi:uncharacterized protein LOC128961630 [Oppia nitens]|uniref:uncharacterized protein LOC128961630 n=1 Tax=Oppia nitens TaxID=1686743 RepID=UPI0023DC19ED|nr:uncharacterized protein LOC128961630 [Oppia nitens]